MAKMTPDERKAYAAEMRAQLESIMERAYGEMVTDPCAWEAVMRAAAVHADRGPGNVIAIATQSPGATQVLSKTEWRKKGRHPAKGSRSLRIWTPIRKKPAEGAPDAGTPSGQDQATTDTAEGGETRKASGFKAGPVYDVSQTDGDECEPPAPCVPYAVEPIRDLLAAQYDNLYGPVSEIEKGYTLDSLDPEAAVRQLLIVHAWQRIGAGQLVPGQQLAEAASAAHVAARMIGIAPGPAPVPPLAGVVTMDKKPPIYAAAVRAIETGRALFSLLDGPDIFGDYEPRELAASG
ncbi:hypothetical protein [Streptomyces sp. NPDC051561]|uniref:hypothetical protein n=1 Tax=Streptomyces sp. NPDC051561 TaxID=3365658 RepID=UPI0037BBA612